MTKQELWEYRRLSKKCENLKIRIKRRRKMLGNLKSPLTNNGPGGGTRLGVDDEIATIDELERELAKKEIQRDESYKVISQELNKVTDFDKREILKARHLKLMTVEVVSEVMGIPQRTVEDKYAKCFDHVLKIK